MGHFNKESVIKKVSHIGLLFISIMILSRRVQPSLDLDSYL
ncbi:hypothetical protein VRK_08980 [Vibrio sp. MEBiC08052]|nr:hypothetical protein VRK_08980 [Vibrio sp. MEBiC08052]